MVPRPQPVCDGSRRRGESPVCRAASAGRCTFPRSTTARTRRSSSCRTKARSAATAPRPSIRRCPLESWRKGDFSALLTPKTGARTVLYDPTTKAPFANNMIPASRINAGGAEDPGPFLPAARISATPAFSPARITARTCRAPGMRRSCCVTRGDHRFSDRDFVLYALHVHARAQHAVRRQPAGDRPPHSAPRHAIADRVLHPHDQVEPGQ